MAHLWLRLQKAKQTLTPVQSKYRIVYEDNMDEPVKILAPDPNFMAAALAGGVLPPVEAYLRDKKKQERWLFKFGNMFGRSFAWALVGGAEHPYAAPIGPMSEEEVIEYLVMKDVPKHVWPNDEGSNMRKLTICKVEQIPTDRTYRDAWSIANEAAA